MPKIREFPQKCHVFVNVTVLSYNLSEPLVAELLRGLIGLGLSHLFIKGISVTLLDEREFNGAACFFLKTPHR